MMKYNEWKLLQEANQGFTLGLKGYPVISGPMGSRLAEGDFGADEEEEDDDLDDAEEDFVDDEELEDDQLNGDIMGASADEGGPEKSFPPGDSEELAGGDDDEMGGLLGDIDPDLAGLGGDSPFGGAGPGAPKAGPDMGGLKDLTAGPDMGGLKDLTAGPDMGGLKDLTAGPDMGGDMGGLDDLAAGGPDMGGLDDLAGGLGGPEMGGEMGGEMGVPCQDCNPDGNGEPDPECQTCMGIGFMPDDMAGGEIDGQEIDAGIEKMGFLDKMTNYQKKYMPASSPVIGAATGMTPQMPGAGQAAPQARPQFSKKFMGKRFMGKMPMPAAKPAMKAPAAHPGVQHMCKSQCMESIAGTYQETQEDFFATLANQAKGEVRKKWKSGVNEDALFQAVEPQSSDPQAGQVGFAPQGRVGAVGAGGYTKSDISEIPVLESKKYPTLNQYLSAKKAARRR